MPNIKIYYFDFPFWRAEVSRLALHLGNVSYHCLVYKVHSVRTISQQFYHTPFAN